MTARTSFPSITHAGGCHCGAVRFKISAPAELEVDECNCSICAKTNYLHLIVDKADFTLLYGEEALQSYRFNTGTAEHLFCQHCGIKSFYVPRSHPEGYSVNARCLDAATISKLTIRQFDGRNWEASVSDYQDITK